MRTQGYTVRRAEAKRTRARCGRRLEGSFETRSFRVGDQVHFLHFLDVLDGDGVRPFSFEKRSGYLDVLAEKKHKALTLVFVGHAVGNRRIDNPVFGEEDQRRACFGAWHGAFEVERRRGGFLVLDGAGDVADQTFDGRGRCGIRFCGVFLSCRS